MKRTPACVLAMSLLTSSPSAYSQSPPSYPREATVPEIPEVVAAGAQWEVAWWGLDDADGVIATPDGGIMFTQAAVSRVRKLDPDGSTSILFEDTNHGGTLGIDANGRLAFTMRPPRPAIGYLLPERRIIADNHQGRPLTGAGDIVVDSKGGFYFNESRGDPANRVHYVTEDGQLFPFGEGLLINGITLSPDETTLYVTDVDRLVAFDILPVGTGTNEREFAKLLGEEPRGDGMCVDAEGRIYVATRMGIQVFSPEGERLGVIPTPRLPLSIAFSGPEKKTLFITSRGAVDEEGVEHPMNPARTIYKLPMVAQGHMARAK